MEILKGNAHIFGDDINTDYIINSKYKANILDIKQMSKHLMEDIDKDFYGKIHRGDFIVAGNNFGCGSSREAAPRVIQAAGIQAILAKSFARIFYRNCFNIGLPVVECDTAGIGNGDVLVLDLDKGIINNNTAGNVMTLLPVPEFMIRILDMGGLEPYLKTYHGFKL